MESKNPKERRREMLEYQIIFQMRSLSKRLVTTGNGELVCRSDAGAFKNAIGEFVMRPNNIYAFTFLVLTANKFKVGVVEKDYIDGFVAAKKKLKMSFTDEGKGVGVYSFGRIHSAKAEFKEKPVGFTAPLCALDRVTLVVDTFRGELAAFVNGEIHLSIFSAPWLREKLLYPAVALLGENARLKLTHLEVADP